MSSPVNKTNPAEFVFTHFTCHMIAAFILFNRYFTVWTIFSVLLNILHAQSLLHDSSCPFAYLRARQRSMSDRVAAYTHTACAFFTALHNWPSLNRNFDVQIAVKAFLKASCYTIGISNSELLFIFTNVFGWDSSVINYGIALGIGAFHQ
jgi:hypothetical protein